MAHRRTASSPGGRPSGPVRSSTPLDIHVSRICSPIAARIVDGRAGVTVRPDGDTDGDHREHGGRHGRGLASGHHPRAAGEGTAWLDKYQPPHCCGEHIPSRSSFSRKFTDRTEISSAAGLIRTGAELGQGAETFHRLFRTITGEERRRAQPQLVNRIGRIDREQEEEKCATAAGEINTSNDVTTTLGHAESGRAGTGPRRARPALTAIDGSALRSCPVGCGP